MDINGPVLGTGERNTNTAVSFPDVRGTTWGDLRSVHQPTAAVADPASRRDLPVVNEDGFTGGGLVVRGLQGHLGPVSYTHLTLPTKVNV